MKRFSLFLIVALCALALAPDLFAAMDDKDLTVSVVATATGTTSRVIRGELYGIYIDVAANSTQTVTVATDEQTLYTKAGVAADVWVPLQYAQYGSTGSALTLSTYGGTASTSSATTNSLVVYSGTNDAAIATNSVVTYSVAPSTSATANPIYGPAPLAGDVTLTVIGAAGTTATNSTTVTVVYRP